MSKMSSNPEFIGTIQHSGCIAVYCLHEKNRCPGCHRSHWHVDRITATCGFCGTVLPLVSQDAPATKIHPKTGE